MMITRNSSLRHHSVLQDFTWDNIANWVQDAHPTVDHVRRIGARNCYDGRGRCDVAAEWEGEFPVEYGPFAGSVANAAVAIAECKPWFDDPWSVLEQIRRYEGLVIRERRKIVADRFLVTFTSQFDAFFEENGIDVVHPPPDLEDGNQLILLPEAA